MRKETSPTGGIIFSVVKIIDKTNKNNNIHFEVNDELSDFKNDNGQYKHTIQRVSEIDTIKKTDTGGKTNNRQQDRNDR